MRLFIILFLSLSALSSDYFRFAESEMKTGNYIYSLVILRSIKGDNKILSKRYFLEGICLSKIGNHSKAISKFIEAQNLKIPIPDFYYEFGKALFLSQEYDRAKKSFSTSLKNNSQITGSLYYLFKIAFSQKDYREAKVFLKQILGQKDLDLKVKQEVLNQLGDTHLKIAKNELKPEDLKEIVSKHVLPYYENALRVLPSSEKSKKIKEKAEMVKKKYNLL